jgi:hypothetical protein
LAGERSEPSIVSLYQQLLSQYAAPDARVIDNWWSSESGSPMTGLALRPAVGKDPASTETHKALQIKPGSAGKPMPGFDVRIVDDEGQEVKASEMGNIVLAMPLGPTAFTTLFNDDMRFYKGYLKRFRGRWVDTGDAGLIDEDGYVHVMSRSDDIINVAAHRFSTGEVPRPRRRFGGLVTHVLRQVRLNKPSSPTPAWPRPVWSACPTRSRATSHSPSSPRHQALRALARCRLTRRRSCSTRSIGSSANRLAPSLPLVA